MSSQKGSILFVIIKIAYVYLLYSRPYNIGAVLLLGVRTTSFHLISFPSRSLRLKREPKKSFLLWLYNVKKGDPFALDKKIAIEEWLLDTIYDQPFVSQTLGF